MVKAKCKGSRVERELVNELKLHGLNATRVPLSGAGSIKGDIMINIDGHNYVAEAKARANGEGFKKLEDWLGGNDFLVLKKDRSTPMVCMTWDMFLTLMEKMLGLTKKEVKDEK
jgi:Holliday junction resolvase